MGCELHGEILQLSPFQLTLETRLFTHFHTKTTGFSRTFLAFLVDTIWFELKCENNRWWRCSPKKNIYEHSTKVPVIREIGRSGNTRELFQSVCDWVKTWCIAMPCPNWTNCIENIELSSTLLWSSLYLILFDLFVFLIHCVSCFCRPGPSSWCTYIWHDWVAVELVWFKDLANASETNYKSSKGSWAKWLSLVHTSHEMALW